MLVWTDVTYRKQAEAKERAQQQQLVHLGRAAVLGELSGAFAHELTQPLTSILGNAEAALQLLTKPDADLREIRTMVRDIVADDVRAAEVIQRLRAMLQRGEISREPVDLANVIKDVLDLARIDLLTRHVSVDVVFDPYLPLVLGDRIQLQQVVLNLVVNACESMSSLDVHKRRISITARFEGSSCEVLCAIRDRGAGIASDDLERIFQPFVTTKVQGLGMGLAICRSIIEAHGGRLWARERTRRRRDLHFQRANGLVGQRSTIDSRRLNAKSARWRTAFRSSPSSTTKNPFEWRSRACCARRRSRCLSTAAARTSSSRSRRSMPDCAVLDFQMPGLTGRDVQRALSVAKLSLPIIIVTAHDQPSLREKVLADGAVAYFTKPLRRDTLIAALDQAIRRDP